jgi:hypothetical protein
MLGIAGLVFSTQEPMCRYKGIFRVAASLRTPLFSNVFARGHILLVPARPYLTTHGPRPCEVKDFGIYVPNNRFMLTGRSHQGDMGGKFSD